MSGWVNWAEICNFCQCMVFLLVHGVETMLRFGTWASWCDGCKSLETKWLFLLINFFPPDSLFCFHSFWPFFPPFLCHLPQFGDSQQLRLVRILRSTVMVRVGGGWMALDEFLVKNDPCRGEQSGHTNRSASSHLYTHTHTRA